jgi:hypothetical protein
LSSHISHAEFVFVDLGTKRGLGHACRVTVDLLGGGQVRYEARAGDHYKSAAQAIVGTARHIQRALERRRGYVDAGPSAPPPAA